MNDSTSAPARRLTVLAVVERDDKPTRWVKIGVAFTNRDGSTTLYLDALPVGTNKLQVREEREWAPRQPANGNGFGAAAPAPFGEAEAQP
jgi:hypothetical protein